MVEAAVTVYNAPECGMMTVEDDVSHPTVGSLWLAPRGHSLLGHEEGDVIIVVSRVIADFNDELKMILEHNDTPDQADLWAGYMCLNRRGLVFYSMLWWSDCLLVPLDLTGASA